MMEKIFKEPGGGRRAWIFVLIACYFFVESVFFRSDLSEKLVYLIFGVAVLILGVAESLPRDQTRLAGMLRIGCVTLMILILIIRALQLATLGG